MTARAIRSQDSWGSGVWQASRGVDSECKKRYHNGVDLINEPGDHEIAFCDGEVTKIWYPYSQNPCNPSWSDEKKTKHRRKRALRYVQITDFQGVKVRLFYIAPSVVLHDRVKKGDPIGIAQDLTVIYPKDSKHKEAMTQHAHIECIIGDGFVEPIEYLNIELEK